MSDNQTTNFTIDMPDVLNSTVTNSTIPWYKDDTYITLLAYGLPTVAIVSLYFGCMYVRHRRKQRKINEALRLAEQEGELPLRRRLHREGSVDTVLAMEEQRRLMQPPTPPEEAPMEPLYGHTIAVQADVHREQDPQESFTGSLRRRIAQTLGLTRASSEMGLAAPVSSPSRLQQRVDVLGTPVHTYSRPMSRETYRSARTSPQMSLSDFAGSSTSISSSGDSQSVQGSSNEPSQTGPRRNVESSSGDVRGGTPFSAGSSTDSYYSLTSPGTEIVLRVGEENAAAIQPVGAGRRATMTMREEDKDKQE